MWEYEHMKGTPMPRIIIEQGHHRTTAAVTGQEEAGSNLYSLPPLDQQRRQVARVTRRRHRFGGRPPVSLDGLPQERVHVVAIHGDSVRLRPARVQVEYLAGFD